MYNINLLPSFLVSLAYIVEVDPFDRLQEDQGKEI